MTAIVFPPSSMQQQIARVAAMHAQQHAGLGLSQPRMMRGATAPTAIMAQMQPPRPILRATVVAGESANATPASSSGINLPLAAHVIADAADVELAKRLQSRLGTLGIGMNMVKVEVRANDGSSSAVAPAGRSFTLTLNGRIQLALGSLFNILIAQFLRQHSQITQVERKITFVPSGAASAAASLSASSLSRARSGEISSLSADLDDDSPCLDSPPILQLKIKHLAKLMSDSANTVVYVGDHLCQAAAVSSSAAAAADSPAAIADLSAPHPPTLLIEWARTGRIQHIINENTDGLFNTTPAAARSAKQPSQHRASSMSDDDSSCNSDDDGSSSSGSHSSSSSSRRRCPLSAEQLSEVYGNKYQEVCSIGCGQPGMPGNASVFTRDFEVQTKQMPLRVRPAGMAQPQQQQDAHLTGRFCSYCSAPLRATLIGFNESVPRAILQRCVATASQADLSLVLGSRLRVSPVAELPALAPASSALVIVQASATAKDAECLAAGGILIRATPTVVLAKLDAELKRIRRQTVVTAAQQATPAIVHKATVVAVAAAPSAAAASGPAAAVHAVRAIAMRPASSQLASSLSRRDMKKRSYSSATASALALFTQRRGAPANLGALARPNMLRASTAAPSLLSMSASGRRHAPLPLSAALPPFPCLDAESGDEDEDAVPAASAPSRAYSEEPLYARGGLHGIDEGSSMMPPRISSITSAAGAGAGSDHRSAVSSASMLMMMAALPTSTSPSAESLMPPSLQLRSPQQLHSPMPFANQSQHDSNPLSPPMLPHNDEMEDDQRMN